MRIRILTGDCRDVLSTLDAGSVQTCVTSPPYFGLRDYGVAGQIGLESTPDAFVAEMVAVFREVKRVLRDDGTLWLNLGDSYAGSWGAQGRQGASGQMADRSVVQARSIAAHPQKMTQTGSMKNLPGLKPKDLIGIPWRVAFALQTDGWYLRSDIIWHKPNPMPESVTDRPTKSHEYLFLLAKSERYYYDSGAIAEPAVKAGQVIHAYGSGAKDRADVSETNDRRTRIGLANWNQPCPETRNRRSVWTVATQPYSGAHFATFPPALIEPCILAGSKRGDTVLDPFGGAGTTGLVADRLGRDALLIELNPEYAAMARTRIDGDAPLFAGGAA
jgi:DNA modification methylase